MKNSISNIEVSVFKNRYCDENQIISNIISTDLLDYFIEPILDVGSGPGDIVYKSLYNKKVICIDVNEIDEKDFPLSTYHNRMQVNFFDYLPSQKIKTVFISHTLQFLDDNIEKLNNKIHTIDPTNIILVLNKNNDIMGELIKWTIENVTNPNPEVKHVNFPQGYALVRTIDFKSQITCSSYDELINQISYLFLIKLSNNSRSDLIKFLKERLPLPEFQFNQIIEIHEKERR